MTSTLKAIAKELKGDMRQSVLLKLIQKAIKESK